MRRLAHLLALFGLGPTDPPLTTSRPVVRPPRLSPVPLYPLPDAPHATRHEMHWADREMLDLSDLTDCAPADGLPNLESAA